MLNNTFQSLEFRFYTI